MRRSTRQDPPSKRSRSDSPPWHGLSIAETQALLVTGTSGLSGTEARRRLAEDGPNELKTLPPPSAFAVLLGQFRSPLIVILLVAALVTVAIGELIDAGVIAAVLVLNAAIGFTQERKAETAVRALMELVAPHSRAIRDGREWDVESRDLARGDLVLLESGARVPADLRLIDTTALTIDESLLTGESAPVRKQTEPVDAEVPLPDRLSMAYTGSAVASGRGRGYVVETAGRTELGKIAHEVGTETQRTTPLQERMTRFARLIGIVVMAAAAVAFAVGTALGESPAEMFLVAVALAVAAIPEGLPVAFTIALAVGVRRMARRNAIIRRLPAVETLGSTTVIGSDKTGTLTENRMTVREIWTDTRTHYVPEEDGRPAAADPLYLTLTAGVLANEAELYRTAEGEEVHGDPTETALLVAASRYGMDPPKLRSRWPEEAMIPFESERRYAGTYRRANGHHTLFVKGAPERVAEMCTTVLTEDGPRPIDRDDVLEAARNMAGRGLRVLAMAYRRDETPTRPESLLEPDGLVLLGLQGMLDPPRDGVRDAIAGCRSASMRVVMITGDHAITARRIAEDLGIATPDAPVLTGVELDDMDDDEMARALDEVSVFARVSPHHKLRVVRALQDRGEVVAVTGDGVNDAPALKAAEIGIAMGRSGTDVAREASDMVLADDNFVSIYAAVEEGRIAFDNLRKVTFFLVSSGAAAVFMILAALAADWPIPLLPAQILWLNLVTNGLQDVALAFEPGERGILRRPPRTPTEGIVSPLLWERTVVAGVVMGIGTLALFRLALDAGASLEEARTTALTTMVLFQAFHAGNSRSESRSIFGISPFSNRFLLLAVLVSLAVHIGALYLPFTRFVLRVEPLAATTWVRMAAVAATIIAAMEIHKVLRSRRRPEGSKRRPWPG